MDIQKIKADKLIPAIYNPRKNLKKGDAEYKKIERSILEFGYVDPIIVNKDMTIIGGHQRYKVLVNLGYDELDCVVVDLPKDREKALNIALNKISGEWDEALLIDLLGDLGDLTELTGFDAEELDKLFDNKTDVQEDDFDADAAVAAIVEPITKRGDIYLLGRHRLMCGDSTMIDDVDKLMDGKKADMVFTDPPYGMNLDTDWSSAKSSLKFASEKNALGGNKHRRVIGDNEDFTPELINTIFACFDYCKEIFLWGADYYSELLPDKNKGAWIVWDKRLDESADKMYGSCFELCWSKTKHKRMIARVKWAGIFGTEKEPEHKRFHPTQKPLALVKWFFDYYSLKDKNNVVDLYGGSGSTLMACEQLNRICYMMELDEKYCDVIIKRWEDFTGQKAELISG